MSELKHPFDQQEIYKQDVVFFAKCQIYHYQNVTEPNLLPHAYEMYVQKSKLDDALSKVSELQKEVTKWKGNFTVKQGIVEELMKDVAELQSAREVIESFSKLKEWCDHSGGFFKSSEVLEVLKRAREWMKK